MSNGKVAKEKVIHVSLDPEPFISAAQDIQDIPLLLLCSTVIFVASFYMMLNNVNHQLLHVCHPPDMSASRPGFLQNAHISTMLVRYCTFWPLKRQSVYVFRKVDLLVTLLEPSVDSFRTILWTLLDPSFLKPPHRHLLEPSEQFCKGIDEQSLGVRVHLPFFFHHSIVNAATKTALNKRWLTTYQVEKPWLGCCCQSLILFRCDAFSHPLLPQIQL